MVTVEHKRRVNLGGKYSRLFLISLLSAACFIPITKAAAETSPWQGPYIGMFTGAGLGTNQVSTTIGSTSNSFFQNSANSSAVSNAGTFSGSPSTVLLGAQAGEDWASQHAVYGVVMDLTNMPLSSSQSVSNVAYPNSSNAGTYSASASMNMSWLFTLRGRFGYATNVDNWPALFYLTTGAALSEITVNNSFSDTGLGGSGGSSTSAYTLGWTAGAGVELLAFNHVSVDLEYLYVQLPSVSTSSTIYNINGGPGVDPRSLSNPFSTSGKLTANLIKLGLNYRF